MHILITAGPTREYVDDLRFLTNASSGRMGYAVAAAARRRGHDVTLLSGPVAIEPPAGCRLVPFVTVEDLQQALAEHFPSCQALVMSAAVGDFAVVDRRAGKIPRSGGGLTIRLEPTPDLLAGLAGRRRSGQRIVAFAVESGTAEEAQGKARAEMHAKGADLVVVNPPGAMGQAESFAAILSPEAAPLPWARRSKDALAEALVTLLEGGHVAG